MDKDESWLSVPEVAESLGIPQRAVRQYLREKILVAVRRGPHQAWAIPGSFLTASPDGNCQVLPRLAGTITVLADAGFSDEETVQWLLSTDEELGLPPIRALQHGQVHAVRRVAQALAL